MVLVVCRTYGSRVSGFRYFDALMIAFSYGAKVWVSVARNVWFDLKGLWVFGGYAVFLWVLRERTFVRVGSGMGLLVSLEP